eukprot:TRINITY_DN5922_c0_g2_i1.p1 TRINITY_DN5922_c0_g2~~TRINITY_DN5922_c0_g2_i1.p1  ORF type:complete len:385 (-),score=48.51 TRINITY_DN5922_c0_g2_i1:13-1167(-)
MTIGWLSGVFAFFVICIGFLFMLRKYRVNAMKMRQGIKAVPSVNIINAKNYITYQIAHVVIAFIAIYAAAVIAGFLILLIVIVAKWFPQAFILGWGFAWKFFYTSLIWLILSTVINFVLTKYFFAKQNQSLINNRRWFSVYDYLSMYVQVFNSFIGTITNCLTILGAILVLFPRVDLPKAPARLQFLDNAYVSYSAMLNLDHMHNNPVATVFLATLQETFQLKQHALKQHWFYGSESDEEVDIERPVLKEPLDWESEDDSFKMSEENVKWHETKAERSRRIARKWRLFVMLVRHPELVKLRKKNLTDSTSLQMKSKVRNLLHKKSRGVHYVKRAVENTVQEGFERASEKATRTFSRNGEELEEDLTSFLPQPTSDQEFDSTNSH